MNLRTISFRDTAVFLIVAVLLAVSGLAGAEEPGGCEGKKLEVKVFPIRYKPISEAVLLVDQLLGLCGSYKVPKALRVVSVQDEPAQLEKIAQALASWDTPPRQVELTVSLILATRTAPPSKNLAGEIGQVSESLAQLTRFTSFERLGTVTLRAHEGGTAEGEIGEKYVVSFRVEGVDPERGIVRLGPVELFQRKDGREAGAADSSPRRLISMTVNLPEGRMNLVGAPGRGNDKALFLALTAWPESNPAPARNGGN